MIRTGLLNWSVGKRGESRSTELGHPVCAAVEGVDQARKGGDQAASGGSHGGCGKVDAHEQRPHQRE